MTFHLSGVVSYFETEFGFTANETVALMGVHTLGKASRNNSGFMVTILLKFIFGF